LRVCILAGCYYKYVTGGAELQMYLLARFLIANGVDVHYVTFDLPPGAQELDDGIHLHGVKRKSKQAVKDCLRALKPSVLYLRGRHTHLSPFFSAVTKLKIPIIYAFASDIHVRQYFLTLEALCGPNKLSALALALLPGRFIKDLEFQSALRRANVITVQNMTQCRGVARDLKSKVVLQRNVFGGYEPKSTEASRKKSEPLGSFRVAWIANVKPWKRLQVFLEIVPALCQHDNVEVIVAGRCEDADLTAEISRLSSRHPNFRYLGQVSQNTILSELKSIDVLVNTSSIGMEGFPNTFIQSWSFGVPTYSLAVNPDRMITDLGVGYCANDDLKCLEAELIHLINNPAVREGFRDPCLRTASDLFSDKNFLPVLDAVRKLSSF